MCSPPLVCLDSVWGASDASIYTSASIAAELSLPVVAFFKLYVQTLLQRYALDKLFVPLDPRFCTSI